MNIWEGLQLLFWNIKLSEAPIIEDINACLDQHLKKIHSTLVVCSPLDEQDWRAKLPDPQSTDLAEPQASWWALAVGRKGYHLIKASNKREEMSLCSTQGVETEGWWIRKTTERKEQARSSVAPKHILWLCLLHQPPSQLGWSERWVQMKPLMIKVQCLVELCWMNYHCPFTQVR